MAEFIHGIPEEEIIEKTDNQLTLKVFIPSGSDYFDGHFPQFKLLPAVAQIDLVVHYVHKYFGTKLCTAAIKRFKFSDKILPDTELLFKIKFDRESLKVSFEILDSEKSYASGNYIAEI